MVLIHAGQGRHAQSGELRFRPLVGIMVLINWMQTLTRCFRLGSFRPLAGIMVLIAGSAGQRSRAQAHRFRPLAGIMVLITFRQFGRTTKASNRFPSPCGDYGSYQYETASGLAEIHSVSVPLRGLWFLSTKFGYWTVIELPEFPSPCGDYGSYHHLHYRRRRIAEEKFPSPYGDCGSYLVQRCQLWLAALLHVSVPLRGLWFLSAPFINGFMKP